MHDVSALPPVAQGTLPIADHAALRAALAEAHLPTLLMVLVHLTGDTAALARYAPHIKPPVAGGVAIPEPLAQELRDRLFAVLTDPQPAAALQSRDQVLEMMSTCVGETVDAEFLPLLISQMGFAQAQWPARPAAQRQRVLLIGTGLGGLCNAVMLQRAGYEFEIFEKNNEVGGTWLVNTYPGVGVDTPSHFYSYSFEQSPDWNHYYPKGRDMHAYLVHVAEKYGLRRRVRFGTEVLSCVWDEAAKGWQVTSRGREGAERTELFHVVVSANGLVDRPAIPKIPGLERFRGAKVHTARWDASLDLAGKRVALIGTGASAAQLGPAVAGEVAHLTVFQRSKHWIIRNPSYFDTVSDGVKWALRHIPYYAQWYRFTAYWWASDGLYANVRKDPDWVSDTSVSALNEAIRQYALDYLQEKLGDRPDLMEKATPDYPIFSKRIVLDPGWFDMLKRPNVTLETGAIEAVTEDAIVMADGTRHPVDVIIMATGFEIQRMLAPMTIVGRGGVVLRDLWGEDEAQAYMGVAIPGFPNFLVTPGPNSAPNHAGGQNIIAEIHAEYLVEMLNMLADRGADVFDVRPDACAAWNEAVQDELQKMVWTHPKARSYYRNSKGRVTISCPYRLVDYWTMMRKPRVADFTFD